MMRRVTRLGLATAAGVVCLFVNVSWPSTGQSTLITQADARVGRPLTPVSVAGVNRRVSRRAYRQDYYGGGYAGGGYYGGGYYGRGYGYYGPGAVAAGAVATGIVAAQAAAPGPYLAVPPVGPPAPNYPDWAPGFVHDAVMVEPGQSATVVDPSTGRTCTISTTGYHWCWTP